MNPSTFTTIDDFRSSELWERINADSEPKDNNHLLHSTRYERRVFDELRERFPIGLDEIEAVGVTKLDTFPALTQDTFTSLHSLNPRRKDIDTLTTNARHFNAEIMNYVMDCEQYPVMKSLCESRELVAYEAVNEFTKHIFEKLDSLLNEEALDELNNLEQQQSELKAKIRAAMGHGDPGDAAGVLEMSENIAENDQQIEILSQEG